jgi:hypothetical protein
MLAFRMVELVHGKCFRVDVHGQGNVHARISGTT